MAAGAAAAEELDDKFLRLVEENTALKAKAVEYQDTIRRLTAKCQRQEEALQRKNPGAWRRELELEEENTELRKIIREEQKRSERLAAQLLLYQTMHPHSMQQHKLMPLGQHKTVYKQIKLQMPPRFPGAQNRSIDSRLSRRMQGSPRVAISPIPPAESPEPEIAVSHASEPKVDLHMMKIAQDREKHSTHLAQQKIEQLQSMFDALKENHKATLDQLHEVNTHLKEERRRCVLLNGEVEQLRVQVTRNEQTAMEIDSLHLEIEMLRQERQRYIDAAFAGHGSSGAADVREREATLLARIRELEAECAHARDDIATLEKRVAEESATCVQLRSITDTADANTLQLRAQNDMLKQRVRLLSMDSGIDVELLERALALVQKWAQQRDLSLTTAESPEQEALEREVHRLRSDNAQLSQDLSKLQKLLQTQKRIAEEQQRALDEQRSMYQKLQLTHNSKLREDANKLGERAERIRRLEIQLRDLRYNLKQGGLGAIAPAALEDSVLDNMEDIDLHDDETYITLTIERITLVKEAFGGAVPQTFVAIDFFEHDTQTTLVVEGIQPMFNFRVRFIVRLDNVLMKYLDCEMMRLELYQVYGMDYRLIATTRVSLRELLDHDSTVYDSATLISAQDARTPVGSIWFDAKSRASLIEFAAAYRQSLLNTQQKVGASIESVDATMGAPVRNATSRVNELIIKVQSCSGLQSRTGAPPSPFVTYSFYKFEEYFTDIKKNTSDPAFHDSAPYLVEQTSDLDTYLQSQRLVLCVLDDADPLESFYFGTAEIDLAPLTRNQRISGTFALTDKGGVQNGIIRVDIGWLNHYNARVADEPEPEPYLPQRVYSVPEDSQLNRSTKTATSTARSVPQQSVTTYHRPQEPPRKVVTTTKSTKQTTVAAASAGVSAITVTATTVAATVTEQKQPVVVQQQQQPQQPEVVQVEPVSQQPPAPIVQSMRVLASPQQPAQPSVTEDDDYSVEEIVPMASLSPRVNEQSLITGSLESTELPKRGSIVEQPPPLPVAQEPAVVVEQVQPRRASVSSQPKPVVVQEQPVATQEPAVVEPVAVTVLPRRASVSSQPSSELASRRRPSVSSQPPAVQEQTPVAAAPVVESAPVARRPSVSSQSQQQQAPAEPARRASTPVEVVEVPTQSAPVVEPVVPARRASVSSQPSAPVEAPLSRRTSVTERRQSEVRETVTVQETVMEPSQPAEPVVEPPVAPAVVQPAPARQQPPAQPPAVSFRSRQQATIAAILAQSKKPEGFDALGPPPPDTATAVPIVTAPPPPVVTAPAVTAPPPMAVERQGSMPSLQRRQSQMAAMAARQQSGAASATTTTTTTTTTTAPAAAAEAVSEQIVQEYQPPDRRTSAARPTSAFRRETSASAIPSSITQRRAVPEAVVPEPIASASPVVVPRRPLPQRPEPARYATMPVDMSTDSIPEEVPDHTYDDAQSLSQSESAAVPRSVGSPHSTESPQVSVVESVVQSTTPEVEVYRDVHDVSQVDSDMSDDAF
eukprot:TRINITY_DN995_c0_g1_i1.p1 TRINITY_DN995_c0_g1~~TRINITY_DN995_c0_g1_i1.p1  ORF type:complete len:1498 (-),score=435.67 TRINITY_DN995_c0_g1_i1:109-4602(-)